MVTGMAIVLGVCAIVVLIRCMSSIAYVVIILLLVHLYLVFVLVPEIQAVYQCPPCPAAAPSPVPPPPPPLPKWQLLLDSVSQWIDNNVRRKVQIEL